MQIIWNIVYYCKRVCPITTPEFPCIENVNDAGMIQCLVMTYFIQKPLPSSIIADSSKDLESKLEPQIWSIDCSDMKRDSRLHPMYPGFCRPRPWFVWVADTAGKSGHDRKHDFGHRRFPEVRHS